MSHTPGPWTVHPSTRSDRHTLGITGPNGEDLVITDSGYYPPTLDDALLMAAAPDLLKACQMALNDRMYKDWPTIADALMAALTKAGGDL